MNTIMKKLLFFAAIALLGGMLTACSSDDDEFDVEQVEPALRPLLGYWQYTGPTYDSQVGYIFKTSGEVVRWSIDHSADGCEYKEWHVGTYGIDAEQHFYIKGDSYVLRNEGRIYYITEFSPDEMTIYDATRPEGFQYGKYKKMNGRP